jgi:hypothetical protein
MRRFCAAMLCATLALITPTAFEPSFAGAAAAPEPTVPQGQDPPGADDGEQVSPPPDGEEVIPPPPVGDEDIYIQAPNPEAGHEEEVISPPPSSPEDESSIKPR